MKKYIYGIDAPPVIKQLALTGILALIVGLVGYKFIISHNAFIAIVVLSVALMFTFINLTFVVLMFWSSLFGKMIMRDKIINSLNLKGDETILDVGCGRGLLLIGVAKKLNKNGKAVGIDLWRSEDLSTNSETVTRDNAKLEGVSDKVELISGDMVNMQFNDSQFDVIVSSMAIHNVPTSEGRFKAIQEIVRTLKVSGHLVILDFQHTREYEKYLKQLGWTDVQLSSRNYIMFPPVRVITGRKPLIEANHNHSDRSNA